MTLKTEGRSVNANTEWEMVSECQLAKLRTGTITRIPRLRVKFRTQKQVLLQEMDVKSVFSLVVINPGGAAAYANWLGDRIFVACRL